MSRARTLQLLFAITIALLLAVMFVTYQSMERFNREHQALRGSHLSLRLMESVLSSIKESEVALRDYRRTEDPSAWRALGQARKELKHNMDMVAIVAADLDRAQRIDSLRGAIARAFQAVEGLDALAGGAHDTIVDLRTDSALGILRETRGLHGRMVLAEDAAIGRSAAEERIIGLTTPLLLLTFGLLALLAVGFLFVRALRAMHKAEQAEQEIARKMGQLDQEVRRREFAQRSLRRVLDSSVSAIMAFRSVRDDEARIVDFEWILANHQAEVMLGRATDSLLGARLLQVLPATASSGLFDRFVEVVTTGKAIQLDNVFDINGLGRHLDVHGVKLEDGVVVSYTDVSDRERQRSILRESERLALTGKIARTVAHEVRNPLTNVLLALDQVKEEAGPTSPLQPYAEIIQRNVDRIAQLITEMIDSSRPREVDRKPCDLGSVLNDTVELVRDRIELKHMGLSLDISPDLPVVLLDRNEILLALSNIIINAIEAMEQGQGRLRISATQERGHVRLVIEDNGKGMDGDELSRLFDPFYTGRPGGMGLGLTAARSILNGHGVHIDVTSSPGEGTRFTLVFPPRSAA